jgi:hypothetical protein
MRHGQHRTQPHPATQRPGMATTESQPLVQVPVGTGMTGSTESRTAAQQLPAVATRHWHWLALPTQGATKPAGAPTRK